MNSIEKLDVEKTAHAMLASNPVGLFSPQDQKSWGIDKHGEARARFLEYSMLPKEERKFTIKSDVGSVIIKLDSSS